MRSIAENCSEMQISFCSRATLSSKTCCRSLKTVAKRKFRLLSGNPLVKNVLSIAQNCSETLFFSSRVVLLCFEIQGCADLRILIVLCNSGVRWSVYSFCVLQFRVAMVCVVSLCFAIQGCAGLRILFVLCNTKTQTQSQKHKNTNTNTNTNRQT